MPTDSIASSARLDAFFDPAVLAIVGASPDSGYFRVLQENLKDYVGEICLVNPRRAKIGSADVYPSVLDLPAPVDHALVITPGGVAPSVVEECHAAGVKAVTVYAGDTAPFGSWPISPAARSAIENGDLLLSGPNCLGALSTQSRMVSYALPIRDELVAGSVATISHSGGSLGPWVRALRARGLGSRYAVSTGNEVGICTADYLEYLVQDPGTDIIVLQYLESLGDAPRFVRAAAEALRRGKPILAVRSGRSERGREGVQSHTGRLAPSSRDFEAIAKSVGIVEFKTMDELLEGVIAFGNERVPDGPRISVHTVSGAVCNHVADLTFETAPALSLAEFSPPTRQRLERALAGWSRLSNPLDSSWPGQKDGDTYFELCEALLADDNSDLLMIEGELPRADGSAPYRYDPDRLAQLTQAASKPVFVFSRLPYSPDVQELDRSELKGVSFLQGVGRAVGAVNSYVHWASRRARGLGQATEHRVSDGFGTLDAPLPSDGSSVLLHHELVDFMASQGVDVAPGSVLEGTSTSLPERLRFPVALKRADILHKTDHAGVALNIANDEEFAAAADRLRRIEGDRSGAPLLLVQEMVRAPWEMFVGGHSSDAGCIVVVGLGGIWSEYLQDTSVRLGPVHPLEAKEMLRELRAYPLLLKDRAGRRADIDWLAETIANFSKALQAASAAGYEALELNPVMVGEEGMGGVAVDMRGELV
jgi:acyl-CoA synthetase (NDP forming)